MLVYALLAQCSSSALAGPYGPWLDSAISVPVLVGRPEDDLTEMVGGNPSLLHSDAIIDLTPIPPVAPAAVPPTPEGESRITVEEQAARHAAARSLVRR